jgi:peptide/nickel transport system permease protein
LAGELADVLLELPRESIRDRAWPLRAAVGTYRFARGKPLGAFGAVIILLMILAALFTFLGLADNITGYRYDHQVLGDRLQGPSSKHILGTDQLGRDVFSRLFYGSRVSVTVGFLAVTISQTAAALMGVVSGYYGGKFDAFFQRIVDIGQALPGLVALIFVISVVGRSGFFESEFGRQLLLVLALGVLGAPGASRVIRGQTIAIRNNAYIEAATVLGASDRRIIFRHILPNVVHIIIIGASVGIGGAILVESTLAFLGFGLPPPFPTWGSMLNRAREYTTQPLLAIFPGLAITMTVFAFNVFGDALRDVWDPRLRGSR